ncbi:carbohydrate ABC transporter permease [Clostridiales bacterium COT073_COT-073]|nr:carbohydrate ABC transporter permease [Clostridiales bacterium COT073_COT-073]
MNKKPTFSLALMYGFLIILLIVSLVPFYLMIINGTHNSFDIVTKLNLLPGYSLKDNYLTMQSHVNIWRGFVNSLCITIPYTLLSGYFGAMTAFGFAKYNFYGKKFLFGIVMASMMIPTQVTLIGFYHLNLRLGLLNSYWPFIIPGLANATTVFFLRAIVVQSISDNMLEAARIEGCSEGYIFNHIVLPCIMPGVFTMSIFNFVASWNNYIGPLIIMTRNEMYTMPVMIAMIKGLYLSNYGAMYLAIAISVIPIILVFCFFSKYIINGLTVGVDK